MENHFWKQKASWNDESYGKTYGLFKVCPEIKEFPR